MKQINIKEIPTININKLKSSYLLDLKNKYNLMGLEFNLTESQIEEDTMYFFNKCVFFYDPFYYTYYYSELKKIY